MADECGRDVTEEEDFTLRQHPLPVAEMGSRLHGILVVPLYLSSTRLGRGLG